MFTLQNSGYAACAVVRLDQTEFITIGGEGREQLEPIPKGTGPILQGNVARWSNHICAHSVRGTTLKADTWAPFPTWPYLERCTPAQVFSWKGRRWKFPQVVQISFFCFSNRSYLLLEVGATIRPPWVQLSTVRLVPNCTHLAIKARYQAQSASSLQGRSGQEKKNFQGENICEIIS